MRQLPPPRSSIAPKIDGESKCGRHIHSIEPSEATSAPVWQSDRKPRSAIGGNGESKVGSFREPALAGGVARRAAPPRRPEARPRERGVLTEPPNRAAAP